MPLLPNMNESDRIIKKQTRILYSNYLIQRQAVLENKIIRAYISNGSSGEQSLSRYIHTGPLALTLAEYELLTNTQAQPDIIVVEIVPEAPTAVYGIAGNAQINVVWTPPVQNGGPAITGYIVSSISVDNDVTTILTPGTVTNVIFRGLSVGINYTFTVIAVNIIGQSTESSPSLAIKFISVPSSPTIESASSGNASVYLSWSAPNSSGGIDITGYTVSSYISGVRVNTYPYAPSITTARITGLTNGTPYTFTVNAANIIGPSAESSESNSVIPIGPPSSPTNVLAIPSDSQVSLSWSAPIDTGGVSASSILYTVVSNPGNITINLTGSTSTVVSGLTNGTSYTFTVTANNDTYTSQPSVTSQGVIPYGIPGIPIISEGAANPKSASIKFTINNGGAAIQNYLYSCTLDGIPSFIPFIPPQSTTYITITSTTKVPYTDLLNETQYTIQLIGSNLAGIGQSSSKVYVTPIDPSPPYTPTDVIATPLNRSTIIRFTNPKDGHCTITNYLYSSNSGASFTAFSPPYVSSPVILTGLTNGTTYGIQLKAQNGLGTSPPTTNVDVVPGTTPSKPLLISSLAGNAALFIRFNEGSNGGNPITSYYYSTDTIPTFISTAYTSNPFSIQITSTSRGNVLVNNSTYNIQIRASNYFGFGEISSILGVPANREPPQYPPTNLIATANNCNVNIDFTPPAYTGGNNIINYQYSLNSGVTFIPFTPPDNTSPVTIPNLAYASTYRIQLKVSTMTGVSPASETLVYTTLCNVPYAPTSLSLDILTETSTLVTFSNANSNGSRITNYHYSLDSGSNFTPFSPPYLSSPVIITGLTRGPLYNIQLRAENGIGIGMSSLTVQARVGDTVTSIAKYNPVHTTGIGVFSTLVYVANRTNNYIAVYDTILRSTISTLTGGFSTPYDVKADAIGNLYVANNTGGGKIIKVSQGNVRTEFAAPGFSFGLALMGSTLYGTDYGNNTTVRTFNLETQQISTLTASTLQGCWGVTLDTVGNIYVANRYSNTISMITPSGVLTTIAGGGATGKIAGTTNGVGTSALFDLPTGIDIDKNGYLYVGEYHNSKIRKLTVINGVAHVSSFVGGGESGTISGSGLSKDGVGTNALFSGPIFGMGIDRTRNILYVNDGFGDGLPAPLGNSILKKIYL